MFIFYVLRALSALPSRVDVPATLAPNAFVTLHVGPRVAPITIMERGATSGVTIPAGARPFLVGPFDAALSFPLEITSDTPQSVAFRGVRNYGGGLVFGSVESFGGLTVVASAEDFPDPDENGVRHLPEGSSYLVTSAVDLGDTVLSASVTCAIAGISPETCSLSTDRSDRPLLYADGTITLRDVTFVLPENGVGVHANGATYVAALDWIGVNFRGTNADVCVQLTFVQNAVFNIMAFFGPAIRVENQIDTLAVDASYFLVSEDGPIAVDITDGTTINRRVRIQDSVLVVPPLCTGVRVGTGVNLNVESLILRWLNMSGGGTLLDGIAVDDDEARWKENRGIPNSIRLGHAYTSTSDVVAIGASGTFYTVPSLDTVGAENTLFSLSGGTLTYDSDVETRFAAEVHASFESGNNRQIQLRLAVNGTPVGPAITATTNGSGRSENVSLVEVLALNAGDDITIEVANASNADNVTFTFLKVLIVEL